MSAPSPLRPGLDAERLVLTEAEQIAYSDVLQEQLRRGVKRRAKQSPAANGIRPPVLPLALIGQGALLAQRLSEIARQCGGDMECIAAQARALTPVNGVSIPIG